MSSFVKHTSCERCGSSDAKALYLGGSSFCFSCRTSNRGRISPYVNDSLLLDVENETISLPHDCGFDYSSACLSWVFKYGVTIDELIKNKVYWSEEKQQLIFTFWDEAGNLLLWQGRNFSSWARTKYFTKGKPDEILPIYPTQVKSSGILVVVEDCISAIRIARQTPSMPVLGSDLSLSKLKRLRAHLGPSVSTVTWLDGNKYDFGQKIGRRLSMLGLEARAIYTELDPKEYDDETIKSKLFRYD